MQLVIDAIFKYIYTYISIYKFTEMWKVNTK